MNILLTGGFFGSGKTTVLSKITALLLSRGLRICIIENEIGQNSIDDLLLKTGSVEISTITGGCICCQISGSLIEALRKMEESLKPDWVLVELTGAAFADAVVDNLRMYLPGEHRLTVMAVADAARWPVLMKAAKPMIQRQLRGANVIAVNKADEAKDLDDVMEQVRSLMPECQVLSISAVSEDCTALLTLLEQEAMVL